MFCDFVIKIDGGLIVYIYMASLIGMAGVDITSIMILVEMTSFYEGLSTKLIGTFIGAAEIYGGYNLITITGAFKPQLGGFCEWRLHLLWIREARLHMMVQCLRDLYEYSIVGGPDTTEIKQ